MDQEDSSEVKREPIASDPDSVSSFDSSTDSSLSEEETVTQSLSPLCKQYKDSCCVLEVSDEDIIESIHQSLLRIIISLQLQGDSGVAASEIWCFDDDGGCKTPPSRISDTKLVPDTCPGAPMKLTKISRNIDSGLRRKLF